MNRLNVEYILFPSFLKGEEERSRTSMGGEVIYRQFNIPLMMNRSESHWLIPNKPGDWSVED